MVLEPKSLQHSRPQVNKTPSEKTIKKIKCLQQNLKILKEQTKQNNEANERNRDLLNTLSKPVDSKTSPATSVILDNNNNNKENKFSHLKSSRKYSFEKTAPVYSVNNTQVLSKTNISKVNRDLIEYVKFRETYLEHINYWEQIWLFTDNPIYEYEHCEGFENPTYSFLNAKKVFELELEEKLLSSSDLYNCPNIFTSESLPTITPQSTLFLNQTFKYQQRLFQNYSSVMNLYESILDANQSSPSNETQSNSLVTSASIPAVLSEKNAHFNFDSGLISSPGSSDSGIHSDDLLSRHSTTKDELCSELKKSSTKSSEDSLYSSVTASTKKSTDSLSAQLDSEDTRDTEETEVVHLEQHEMPLGWIRCADEAGIYYWHKPTGTVTRKPPICRTKQLEQEPVAPAVPKKNFKIDEYSSFQQINELINGNMSDLNTLCSPSSTSTSSSSESRHDMENNFYDTADDIDLNSVSSVSLAMSEPSVKSNLSHSSSILSQQSPSGEKTVSQRFYVRSLGWVKIDESDLTPERSSKAVNRCINDLSRGHKDLNDVVASWGEGKDLYMDLEGSYLILVDTNNETVLNRQSITSIRVWGVGRDNGRDFAYVARDKQTKIHMCHVFRCDSAPAKEIANSLRDTCRRIINEKKKLKGPQQTAASTGESASPSSLLKRTSFLPEVFSPRNSDFSRYKSTSCQNKTEFKGQIHKSQTESDGLKLVGATEEPRKTIECKYLGSVNVAKPAGMDVLNEAIEKIYVKAIEDLRRTKKQTKLRNRNQLKAKNDFFNDKNDYEDEDEDDDEDYENYDYRDNAFSLDSLSLDNDKKLGVDVGVVVSPSTVSVNKYSNGSNDSDALILECRIRYLSFMGISNDVRLCGFIVHCIDNTFKCHAFLCENSAGGLMKLIEAACRLRYQKCLDAHPEAAQAVNSNKNKESGRFNFIGSQLKGMFDSLKSRNIFSNYSLAESQN